ncbi:MAG: aldehyde dehydrogenase [Micromonosporaceae bacterium]|jgi:succinate-semialdehyde dehydrogenase/glutarate-semialdehyde dehydrogenase|nr:aldehyde dehydrogenase [Micromonosporaceae bacterium]
MYQVEQLIGGEWGIGGTAGELVVADPADGRPVTRAPVASDGDVDAAVKTARQRASQWARTAPADRAAALARAADAVAADAERLALLTTQEMGRPLEESRAGVAAGVATLRQYAELGPLHRGRSLAGDDGAVDLMVHQPRGVVAVITPWNDPVAVSCGLLGAALVTGNTVVYKPSERTPGTGHALARLLAGELPAGVLNLLSGGGRVGARLAGQDVDVVAHVGSTATGRSIAAACARTGAKAVLENGGSDPLIVDADVDPYWAAEQVAVGAFSNAGQICTAVERVYVHRAVAASLLEALVGRAAQLRVGPGTDPKTQMGPLVDLAHRDLVHGKVTDAVRRGARLLCGGTVPPGPGSFYPPTVLADCADDMPLLREETFGPVAPVVEVDTFDEALARAGRSPYGLAATVLTGSMAHAQRAWRELPVGTVKVNAVFGGAPGGAAHPRRGSGHGFGYGPELLDELTVTKVVHLRPAAALAPERS